MTGSTSLMRAMGKLFRARGRTCLSTAQLEEHLVLETGAPAVVDAFHRFVYGLDDPRRGSGVRFDRLELSHGPDGRVWISARVSNDRDAEVCPHFLLLFSLAQRAGGPAGSNVPVDVVAVAGFDLQPGRARLVRVRVPIGSLCPDGRAADLDVIGGVHVRLSHPSGESADYRGRTMMRAGVRPTARPPEPAPVIPSPG
jgi:hypothetical protein